MNINSKDAKYFEDSYLKFYYSDSSGKLMKKGHQLMENFNFDKHDDILEVGAGFMPHISFLKNSKPCRRLIILLPILAKTKVLSTLIPLYFLSNRIQR